MCVKESALNVTTKQQAAGTPIFTSMYILHAYTTLGLYMCTASIVSTDSKLASSRSQSCLWLEKTTFFHYTPVDLCTLNSAIISRHCMVLHNQKKSHAGKHDQDSMEEQAPLKKARTGNPHVKVCKHSATCKATSHCFDGRMHTPTS